MSTKRSTEAQIHVLMDELAEFIVRKNITYGDSLQNPVRVFSKATGVESISGSGFGGLFSTLDYSL